MLRNFVAGTIAGTLATTFNNPFDVVKSRVQNTLKGTPRKYGMTIPSVITVWKEEGLLLKV